MIIVIVRDDIDKELKKFSFAFMAAIIRCHTDKVLAEMFVNT